MAMGELPPFEDREAYGGFFPALFQTCVGACFRPAKFFDLVGNSQNLRPALIFGVLVGWVGIICSTLWRCVLQALLLLMMSQKQEKVKVLAQLVGELLLAGLFGWLFTLLVIFIYGLILHLFLKILGGANQGLTMTLRVVSYAHAAQIFAAVPFVGATIAVIWTLLLCISGLAAVHRTGTWRAALAVILALIVLLVLFCCSVILIEAATTAALG